MLFLLVWGGLAGCLLSSLVLISIAWYVATHP